ncbi:MAG: alkaline phosphatase family protein [Verrucomicrobiaceae bacterium]|nr:alkaline phosphatase family protein [Verrucomicrobiaceae bacterium]
MRRVLALLLVAVAVSRASASDERPLKRVAFGSCTREYKPQPLWKAIKAAQPDVWVWLGDIVYGEADNLKDLARRYRTLKEQPDYTTLRAHTKVLGIWDDHDYGTTNGGSDNPAKRDVQKLLLDFLDEPPESARRTQDGVYAAYTFGPAGNQAKLILLDGRFHREPRSRLKQWLGLTTVGEADILGAAQWQWLEQQLEGSSADVHLIGSGSQVIAHEHRYEKWADFPKARRRLFDLLAKTRPRNVIFLTGDRHLGEISRLDDERFEQPLYDITSSGMTHHAEDCWYWKISSEPNRYRRGGNSLALNFGLIEFDWETSSAALQIRNVDNTVVLQEKITLAPASDETR